MFYKEAKENNEALPIPKTEQEKLEYDIQVVQDERTKAKIENFYYERFKEVL